MMHDQGPRNNDEHVDVQDLLRSLPSVAAPENFEQKLFERIEAENLNLAHQLTKLPKVPAVADFTDRLHWSIAVHNQINGGVVAQAVEEGVVAVESTGGRIWLRSGLALLAVAIGFGSWAVMGDGSASNSSSASSGPGASGGLDVAPAVTGGTAGSSGSKSVNRAQNAVTADPGVIRNAPVLSFGVPSQSAQKTSVTSNSMVGGTMLEGTLSTPATVQQLQQHMSTIKSVVSSAERSATVEYNAAPSAGAAQAAPHLSSGSDTSSATHADTPVEGTSHAGGIETGAPGMTLDDSQPPTDSIHTGEHRADDTASGRP